MLGKIIKQKVLDLKPVRPPEFADDAPRAALIFGAGALPGIGAAVAMRAARGGLRVYVTGRNVEKIEQTVQTIAGQGGSAVALQVDASLQEQVAGAFERAVQDGCRLELVVHNVGTNRPGSFLDITPAQLEKSWRNDCLSGFIVGQEATKRMVPQERGTLIFTGASASLRGKAGFGSFAAAKAGLRILAQSMAREFGPKGIHVAHVIIDGVVDGDRLRSLMPDLIEQKGEDGALKPADIAEVYWALHRQHRTTWTHELDLRPFKENW